MPESAVVTPVGTYVEEFSLPWPVCYPQNFLHNSNFFSQCNLKELLTVILILWGSQQLSAKTKQTQDISNNKLNKYQQPKASWILWAKPITAYCLFTFPKILIIYSADMFWWEHSGQQPSKNKHRVGTYRGNKKWIKESCTQPSKGMVVTLSRKAVLENRKKENQSKNKGPNSKHPLLSKLPTLYWVWYLWYGIHL